MTIARFGNWILWAVLMALIIGWFGWGGRPQMIGLFIASGLAVGSLYALGGIGIVVLYRATGVLNFAGGAAGAAGAMTAWQLTDWGVWDPISWIACLAVALAITLFYGRLIAPRLAWRETVVKAVATLGFALIILGAVSFLWVDDPRSISLPTDAIGVRILGMRVTATRLLVFFASIGIVVGIWLFLARTQIGLQMRALANDRDLAALMGIPILRVETIAWGISGLLAGFTGLMFADLIRLEPTIITFMVIPSIAAAICGRLENLTVVLLGGLSMGVIENMLTMSPMLRGVRPIAPFVIAALVLLWYQRGSRLTFGGRD
ncbi:branched-chain amino acid ABC transporter permease [Rhodobacter sp. NTK016B]|uniref:branched-chain amino acid ABC transporter permease n=1 Tax=Rhodobacter sp. NTK016B TaxID=2759676 RepID=UPI001A8D9BC5|nr:branched-chain amino acid ABC transporter permease [Rhodobacter sp. NTK016B]MBN8292944.1 branched-chain amino acid ABC transporter permease [Rhodobacter sp. NTK016B]